MSVFAAYLGKLLLFGSRGTCLGRILYVCPADSEANLSRKDSCLLKFEELDFHDQFILEEFHLLKLWQR